MTRDISRQAFLRGTLSTVAAGAVLGACRSTQAHPPTPGAIADPAPSPTGPQDWTALADAVSGRGILPSNPDFATAKSVFNARFDDSTPAAVVAVTSADDVREAVQFAASRHITVAVRSGGHSYIGASAADGAMVIDLRRLPGETNYDGHELAT